LGDGVVCTAPTGIIGDVIQGSIDSTELPSYHFHRISTKLGSHASMLETLADQYTKNGISDLTKSFKIVEDITHNDGDIGVVEGPQKALIKIREYDPSTGLTVSVLSDNRLVSQSTLNGDNAAYSLSTKTFDRFVLDNGDTPVYYTTKKYITGPTEITVKNEIVEKTGTQFTIQKLSLETGLITETHYADNTFGTIVSTSTLPLIPPSLTKSPFIGVSAKQSKIFNQVDYTTEKYYKTNSKQLLFESIKLQGNNSGLTIRDCSVTATPLRISFMYRLPNEPWIAKTITTNQTPTEPWLNPQSLFKDTEIELYNLTVVPAGAISEFDVMIEYARFVEWIKFIESRGWINV
jgi:hypothetical protein